MRLVWKGPALPERPVARVNNHPAVAVGNAIPYLRQPLHTLAITAAAVKHEVDRGSVRFTGTYRRTVRSVSAPSGSTSPSISAAEPLATEGVVIRYLNCRDHRYAEEMRSACR